MDYEIEGGVKKEAIEPPVPAGLRSLTAAQQALVEFLGINQDLLTAAAWASPGAAASTDSTREIEQQAANISPDESQAVSSAPPPRQSPGSRGADPTRLRNFFTVFLINANSASAGEAEVEDVTGEGAQVHIGILMPDSNQPQIGHRFSQMRTRQMRVPLLGICPRRKIW
jgi:hypothetical protein